MKQRQQVKGSAVHGRHVSSPVALIWDKAVQQSARQQLSCHGECFVAEGYEQRGAGGQQLVDEPWSLFQDGTADELVGRWPIGELMQWQAVSPGEHVVATGHGLPLGVPSAVNVEVRERVGEPHPVLALPHRPEDAVSYGPAG